MGVLADFLSRQPLTQALASLEHRLEGADGMNVMRIAEDGHVVPELLASALTVRESLGRINDLIHACGILLVLPHILQDLPHGGGGHLHARDEQLTVDAPISPPGILPRQAQRRTRSPHPDRPVAAARPAIMLGRSPGAQATRPSARARHHPYTSPPPGRMRFSAGAGSPRT